MAVFSPRFRRRLFGFDVVQALLLTIAACVCVLMPKNNWTHYLLLLFVPVTMLNASLLAAFFEEARERRLDIRVNLSSPSTVWNIRGNVFIAASVAFLGVSVPAAIALKGGHPANQTAARNLEEGRTTDPVTAAILRHAKPGEPVANWGVRFHHLTRAGVSLGTRDAHIERALYPSRQQEYYLERFIADVIEREPKVLVDTNDMDIFHKFRLPNFPKEWAALSKRYELVEEVEGNHIYVRRSDDAIAGH